MSSLRVYDHYRVFISIPFAFRACSLIGFTILLSIHVYVSMMSVDHYTVHMTILPPIGGPTSTCFRFRYRFHPGEDLLRESLDLYHDFVCFPVVSSFLCIFFRAILVVFCLSKSMFLAYFFGAFFYSLAEFTSFHSLFTLSFHYIVYALTSLVNSTEDGHICRPQHLLIHYCYYYYYYY